MYMDIIFVFYEVETRAKVLYFGLCLCCFIDGTHKLPLKLLD